jgi:inosine-uridine nucleoside N-ribohydrolase
MDLIVETDIGHDPDDFFALCYLVSAGVNIRAIVIHSGDTDQIAIAKLLCSELGLDIPVGASDLNRDKNSSGSIHHKLLDKYFGYRVATADGLGCDIVRDTVAKYPESEFFVIGPVRSIGIFLENADVSTKRATMQGGFLPYSHYSPSYRLDKFENHEYVSTFNMGGRPEASTSFC